MCFPQTFISVGQSAFLVTIYVPHYFFTVFIAAILHICLLYLTSLLFRQILVQKVTFPAVTTQKNLSLEVESQIVVLRFGVPPVRHETNRIEFLWSRISSYNVVNN